MCIFCRYLCAFRINRIHHLSKAHAKAQGMPSLHHTVYLGYSTGYSTGYILATPHGTASLHRYTSHTDHLSHLPPLKTTPYTFGTPIRC